MKEPKAIIENGRVMNAEQLKRYWANWRCQDFITRREISSLLRDRPSEPEESKPQVVEHIVRHSDIGKKEFDLLQQTARKVDYLDQKINELLAKRKPRGKY